MKTIVVRVNSCQNLAAAKMHMLLSHLSGVQIGLQFATAPVPICKELFNTVLKIVYFAKIFGLEYGLSFERQTGNLWYFFIGNLPGKHKAPQKKFSPSMMQRKIPDTRPDLR